jgi:hypothetical protein
VLRAFGAKKLQQGGLQPTRSSFESSASPQWSAGLSASGKAIPLASPRNSATAVNPGRVDRHRDSVQELLLARVRIESILHAAQPPQHLTDEPERHRGAEIVGASEGGSQEALREPGADGGIRAGFVTSPFRGRRRSRRRAIRSLRRNH